MISDQYLGRNSGRKSQIIRSFLITDHWSLVTGQKGGQTGGQAGGFSPFIFGLVMGMSIFGAMSAHWAKQELVRYQQEQIKRAKANAEDVAKGLDFAILTENQQTYSTEYNLERARQYSNTDARTQGGQDYMVTAREDENRERFGTKATTVAIAGSDDTLLRSQLYRTNDAEQILRSKSGTEVGSKQAVAVYDTSTARDRQVRTTNQRMEILAEQVYAFYAGKKRFPTDLEFSAIVSKFGLRDVWGNPFTYEPDKSQQRGGQNATLSFTTPWNYTQTLSLSLKDESDAAE